MNALALGALLWGCQGGGSGPSRALEEYRAGRGLLEEGDALGAAGRFEAAAAEDPAHSLLRSWQAWALARGGRLDEAIALLEAAPPASLLPQDLFNLGAWNARRGRIEEAVAWLERAVVADPGLRSGIATDPDLDPARAAIEASSALGAEPARALMTGEEGAILAGEPYDLTLLVEGLGDRAVALHWERPLSPDLVLARVVDELTIAGAGESPRRNVAYQLRTRGAGEGDLGPWTLTVGDQPLAVAPVRWQALLPPGVAIAPLPAPAEIDERWWTPREALSGLTPPAAEWRAGRLVVVFSPGDEMTTEPALDAAGALQVELRRDDQAELLARAWPLDPAGPAVRVRLERDGRVVLDRKVRPRR